MKQNRFQKAFPIGQRVRAFDEMDGMIEGVISIHTTDPNEGNGLIVRFDDGHWTEYPYSTIDLRNPENSYVIQANQFCQ